MTVSLQYAAEHLDDILSAADNGESVQIMRPDKPAFLLRQPGTPSTHPQPEPGKRILGAGIGLLRVPSDEEWEAMDREWRASYMHKFDGSEVG